MGGLRAAFLNDCGVVTTVPNSPVSYVTAGDVCRNATVVVMTIEVVETSDVSCSGLLECRMFSDVCFATL